MRRLPVKLETIQWICDLLAQAWSEKVQFFELRTDWGSQLWFLKVPYLWRCYDVQENTCNGSLVTKTFCLLHINVKPKQFLEELRCLVLAGALRASYVCRFQTKLKRRDFNRLANEAATRLKKTNTKRHPLSVGSAKCKIRGMRKKAYRVAPTNFSFLLWVVSQKASVKDPRHIHYAVENILSYNLVDLGLTLSSPKHSASKSKLVMFESNFAISSLFLYPFFSESRSTSPQFPKLWNLSVLRS